MQKAEFEQLINTTVSDEEYTIIETVYNYHPSISDVHGKKQIRDIYLDFGMSVILDMYPRAEKIFELELATRCLEMKINEIKELRQEVLTCSSEDLKNKVIPSDRQQVINEAVQIVEHIHNDGSHDFSRYYRDEFMCQEMADKIVNKLRNMGE